MNDFLIPLLNLSVTVFAVSSMLSIGFRFSVDELIDPLRDMPWVIRALLGNFVLVPLLVYAVLHPFPVELPLKIGIFLIACGAGAPFMLKLVQAARGDVALSGGLLVLLLLVTVIYMPLVVPAVLPEANVSAASIALPLIVTMLLPLGAGHWIRAQRPDWAVRWQPVANQISTLALILVIAGTIVVHFQAILYVLELNTFVLSVSVIVGAFAIGFFLGGPEKGSRNVLGLGTAQRNIAAATVVATQGFEMPGVLVMVVFHSLVTFAILFPVSWGLRRAAGRQSVV